LVQQQAVREISTDVTKGNPHIAESPFQPLYEHRLDLLAARSRALEWKIQLQSPPCEESLP
jgi:hypothetical protein